MCDIFRIVSLYTEDESLDQQEYVRVCNGIEYNTNYILLLSSLHVNELQHIQHIRCDALIPLLIRDAFIPLYLNSSSSANVRTLYDLHIPIVYISVEEV